MTTTYRIDLAYHGGGFSGWAAQPGKRTVQAEVEAALATLIGSPVTLTVAGRTDAGVHALGQVASFEAEIPEGRNLLRALNGMTPEDILVHAAGPAPEGFDARHDARSRTYCFRLQGSRSPNPFERGLSLWWPHRIDREALTACAGAIRGRHDFSAFTPTQTHHRHFERDVLSAHWRFPEEEDGICELWIEADAFLRGMVRALVGTMLEVSSARRSLESYRGLLEGGSRRQAGDSAQAHGLYLAGVAY
jgi:tRNA pseudouridine38-40 synthase